MKTSTKTWFWFVITVLFMSFIFYKSAEPYKKQDIKPYLREHLQLSESKIPKIDFYYDGDHVTSKNPYDFVEFLIRKAGHISEYALLCFLLLKTLRSTNLRLGQSLILSGIASIIYAGSDEWHQSFIAGRTGHLIDVLGPDLLGVLVTLILYLLIARKKDRLLKG
ncbi:MAG TPA: VanZ family protein [Bacillota bacterium]|nr:VanZ family protein [Bacillota bacterium]